MHTISAEQLLKAYNGKYKYVTMDKNGITMAHHTKPSKDEAGDWISWGRLYLDDIAITEFQGKEWAKCIYKAKPSEEDWVGCHCWFSDSKEALEMPNVRKFGILEHISTNTFKSYKPVGRYVIYLSCRPVRPDEIKFFNDDTQEE